jgi:cytochrome c-type biogenesis protein CcmH/NrfG
VVARGRTGRKPTAAEKSDRARDEAEQRQRRLERVNRPPTWRGAFVRALVAAVLVLAASLFLLGKKSETASFVFFPVVVLIYVPFSYYTDLWLYRRRQRNQQRQSPAKREGSS